MHASHSANDHSPELRRRPSNRWSLRAAIAIGAAAVALHAAPALAIQQGCLHDSDCGPSDLCSKNTCNENDHTCQHSIKDCSTDDPCLIGLCNIQSGGCVAVPAEVGTPCSDGQVCNGAETCDGEGRCLPGTAVSAGTPCPDGNLCKGDETCDGAGSCGGGMPLDCDDGHACTADACVPATGCKHTVKAAQTVCREAANSLCDFEEVCDGTSLDCPADLHEPDGTSCDDGNSGTVGESCQGGICTCTGDDLDGDGIPDKCDPSDATTVVKRAVAWPMRDKPGRIKAHGTLRTGVYGAADVIDPSGGFTVTVTDGLGMHEARSVSGAQCRTGRIGSIDCRNEKLMRLLLMPNGRVPGEYRWSVYLRELDFVKPQGGPLTVIITDGRMIDRVGTAPSCRVAETGLPCR